MTIKRATPYLFFNGTAADAIAFYRDVFGAEPEGVMRYADMPAEIGVPAPDDRDRIMHALLHIGEAQVMLSDRRSETPGPLAGNVHINLDFDDHAEMADKFDALAVGGAVFMAPHDTFWGGKFAIVTDKFAIRWMLTSNAKDPS